jgi:hypothetical protein
MKPLSVRDVASKLKNPLGVAMLTGFEIAGTAVAFGVAETLLGVAAAYWAYRALGGSPPEPLEPEANAGGSGGETRDELLLDELRVGVGERAGDFGDKPQR